MFNSADYDQEVYEDRMGITARRQAEREELAREEREEYEARMAEFDETTLCTDVCCETLAHQSAECAALAQRERGEYLASLALGWMTDGERIQAWLDGAPDAVLTEVA
jgi:hypothetical protein